MRMSTRALLVLSLLAALLPAAAPAQEGVTYRTLAQPQPSDSPGKIVVIEFFSYACPHCAHFAPLLEAWRVKQPKDVELRRVPVGFNREPWINLQRAYYALQASGDLAKLDTPLFKAIHEENKPLYDQSTLTEWVGRNGGNAAKFAGNYQDLGVNTMTVQADELAEHYTIDSVPTLAIDGKYIVMADGNLPESAYQEQLLLNAEKVVAMARTARTTTAKKPAAKGK